MRSDEYAFSAELGVNVDSIVMESPAQLVIRVTEILDRVIEDHGHLLFLVAVFVGLAVIIWILVRPRRSATGQVQVAIVLGTTRAKQDPDSEPHPLDDSQFR